MILAKQSWSRQDGNQFNQYLAGLANPEKIEWTKSIINTKLPVLAIKSPVIKSIAKEIKGGNYLSFLELGLDTYYENFAVNSALISAVKDFDVMAEYLRRYSKKIECWAACDSLSFNVKGREAQFWQLSQDYLQSPLPFERRVALLILMKLVNNDSYIDKIFDTMNLLHDESEYYVNMMNAWLLCECFIKQRDKTLSYLKTHKLNKFTINKGISKCRDSFRVSKEDKELLLKYKV